MALGRECTYFHAVPAERELEKKHLDFSLIPPFYLLPGSPSPAKKRLAIEPIGVILWGFRAEQRKVENGRQGWVKGDHLAQDPSSDPL